MTVLQMRGSDEGSQPPQKKRRLSSRLHSEDSRQTGRAWINEADQENSQMTAITDTMVNGYDSSDPFDRLLEDRQPVDEDVIIEYHSPIAPLSNLGNTCFLNSVLYTLRFAPSFLHKLHHLNSDCVAFSKQQNVCKQEKTYSLGRNVGKGQSSTSKDAFVGATSGSDMKSQTVINKLHNLYVSLRMSEMKDRMVEPFQPTSFIQALREVNPIFEGNQQHDAHELLVCILDIIRETCDLLYQQNNAVERLAPPPTITSSTSTLKSVVRKSLKLSKIIRSDKKSFLRENHSEGDIKRFLINGDGPSKDDPDIMYADDTSVVNQNTIFEDFRGVSLLRTTCLECEQVTERKETFCDICVPIQTIDNFDDMEAVDQLYKSIIVTEEYLIDCNKYWCERCCRYNEAKRCVKYEKLPRLLTLHLKRFSSTFGTAVAKVHEHMPTPFKLPCFCEECLHLEQTESRRHYYNLYAIIMHIGSSITSGHYTAYVKIFDNSQDYAYCTRDKLKTSSLSRGYSMPVTQTNGLLDKSGLHFGKYFNKLSSKALNGSSGNGATKEQDLSGRITPSCKGVECCNIRLRNTTLTEQQPSGMWLYCDDEQVSVISTRDLAEELYPTSSRTSTLTPYLLFYSRVDAES